MSAVLVPYSECPPWVICSLPSVIALTGCYAKYTGLSMTFPRKHLL
jgi:hypothetical protein